MSNFKKILIGVFLLILIVLLAELGLLFYYRSFRKVALPSPTPELSLVTPTPQVQEPAISESYDEVESIVSTFRRWEEIEESSDKYILLMYIQREELFLKIRVGFEFSPLFGDETGREDATVFAVEKNEEEYEVLGYFEDFTTEEVDKLIKQGDLIKVILKKKMDKMENLKDENGNLLAHWLFIKREGGKAGVEKELGRTIQIP